MSVATKKPPVFAIAAVAVSVGAIAWFVFFRKSSETSTVPIASSQIRSSVAATNDGPSSRIETKPEKRTSGFVAPTAQDAALGAVRDFCTAEKWLDARAAIARLFATDLPDETRAEFAAIAARVHEKILAAQNGPDVELYEIVAGDSLTKIAQRFKHLKGCYGPIMILNDFKDPAARLRLGRKIRIPKGAWSIVVDKSLFALWICYEGAPIRSFRVAIGRDEKTPAGTFTVGNKNPKPAWYPPQEMLPELKKEGVPIPIPYGHAKNPLGEYWIAIDHKEYSGLGIHGTNDPSSIGSKASNGCIRMDNKEVMTIAWTVAPGTIVTIVE